MDPAPEPTSFRSILGQKNFARLWYGQIISSLGDRFYQFALLYVILGIKQGLDVGKDSARVTFCAMLPGLSSLTNASNSAPRMPMPRWAASMSRPL